MRTSELAARAAVNPQTLRYYERRGLLSEPVRSPGRYRVYPAEAVQRVRFIRRAQELGFTLAEVEVLLHLAEGGPDSCEKARALATDKISDLRRRMADLQTLVSGLTRWRIRGGGPRWGRCWTSGRRGHAWTGWDLPSRCGNG